MYIIHRDGRRTDLRLRRWGEGGGEFGEESFFPIDVIPFRVGDFGRPQDGDTTFILKDCAGNPVIGKHIEWYRATEMMTENDLEFGFTYNPVDGQIICTPALNHKELMKFYVYLSGFYSVCDDTGLDFLMINKDDHLMINNTDKFIL